MTQGTQEQPDTASPARVWLALALALLVALLPGPQAAEIQGQTWLTSVTPALTAHQGREFVARKDVVQIRPLIATDILPPGIALPPPRLSGSVAYARVARPCAASRQIAPCARAPPSLT
ncbi:hypothetical protein SAMN06265221_11198 [Paracoccus laeviglucosivorans]|uniref:Uncharacterized protein n=2 Tax=Paracoccus laeviglucosivorans TaxID=1197861 RepID=A0A521E6F5_9RHOB|nr:hypothetical protein SAMN06265221_11198 [Paracoccus laeviglucosivorans]